MIRQKVVCYIVRGGRLLVFSHLGQPWDASGLQVPAGSIRPGESPESAALREAEEETGLTTLQVVRKVGEMRYDMAPYRFEIQHRHVFELSTHDGTPERWDRREAHPEVGTEQPAFECYWIPLSQGHVLSAGQGALLGLLGYD